MFYKYTLIDRQIDSGMWMSKACHTNSSHSLLIATTINNIIQACPMSVQCEGRLHFLPGWWRDDGEAGGDVVVAGSNFLCHGLRMVPTGCVEIFWKKRQPTAIEQQFRTLIIIEIVDISTYLWLLVTSL